ncbi:DUF2479 domain-containing protein [Enterococcus faecium]|nr:DUF2479 domain-containing protein [Enterococcus faecium]
MARIIKKGPIKVPTQPEDFDLQATGLVFKSYDNQIALEFNVEQQDGTPADLLGANLRLLMFIYDEVDGTIKKEPIPFITKNLITESFLNGHVAYILPEAMKAYNGMVEAYVYIEYPDGSTSDNLGFTFRMQRSKIDGLAQDKADYFITDFQQLLDAVKQKAADAVNETLAKVEAVSENVSSAQNDLTILEDRIDQTNQQISDLGKLKKMYSNSINFGDYDYSGNPNLMSVIKASDFNVQSDVTVSDVGYNSIRITSQGIDRLSTYTKNSIPSLLKGKTYTLSATVKFEEGTTGDIGNLMIGYRKASGGTILLYASTEGAEVGKELTIKGTGIVNYEITDLSKFYLSIGMVGATKIKGGVVISNIKIEEGPNATPYQPNLLDAPYYLSKVALGENIADPTKTFPIKTSSNQIYIGDMEEPFTIGETYTLTIKATKPATQSFRVYNYGMAQYGDMIPVEGLTDVWQLTFTVYKIHEPYPSSLTIYQQPKETVGACQIDWLKIEKGDTRTPNISQFKYFGEGLKDSNNPNDYSWDITPEYAEKGLNDTVSLTEPQSVEGLKNFEDGLQIAGKEVATIANSTGWIALTLVDGFEVAENNPPQYKITYQANGDNEIEFRGEFQLTGGTKFTKDTSYYPFGRANQATNIPNELKPDRTAFGYGATSTGVGGRLAVTTAPTFIFIPGDSDGTYCSISTLRYTQTKK